LVDLVGGVEFHVPQRMFYNDPSQDLYIDLQEGLQTLDGEQAMGLVRYRKGYASQNIMRTQVQQDFMRALAKKCLSLSNLKKIGELSDLFAKYVMTDLSVGNIAYFGQELLKCDFENMFTYTLEGDTVTIDGISYWALYQNKTLRIINEYFNPYETDLTVDDMQILSPERVLARYGDSVVVEKSEGTSDEPAVPEEEDSSSSEPPSDDPFAADPQPGIPTDDPFAADPQPETPPTNSEVWTDGGQTGESYQPTFDDNGFIR